MNNTLSFPVFAVKTNIAVSGELRKPRKKTRKAFSTDDHQVSNDVLDEQEIMKTITFLSFLSAYQGLPPLRIMVVSLTKLVTNIIN